MIMNPPLPPLNAQAFRTAPERQAFAAGVLYGMQGAAEVLEDAAAEELGVGHAETARCLKDAATSLRGALEARADGRSPEA